MIQAPRRIPGGALGIVSPSFRVGSRSEAEGTKHRRQSIYGKLRADIGKILRMLFERKGIEIAEAECCKDHIYQSMVYLF